MTPLTRHKRLSPSMRERRDGQKLLALYRARRRYEVRTLDGFLPKHKLVPSDTFARLIYNNFSDEIDLLSRTIGGRAMTRIRKESQRRKIILKKEIKL